jgi:hypothetical protein
LKFELCKMGWLQACFQAFKFKLQNAFEESTSKYHYLQLIEGKTYDQFSPTPMHSKGHSCLQWQSMHYLFNKRYQNMEGVNGKHTKMCAIAMQFVIGGNKVYSLFQAKFQVKITRTCGLIIFEWKFYLYKMIWGNFLKKLN